jgi:hypothetical protein
LDSSSQSILWASHVLTPAARNRIISPFCRCAACFGDVLLNTAKVIFEAHSNPRNTVGIGGPFCPIDA